jgi:hypothetical protein
LDPAVTVEQIERHQRALERITRPVSDEEATLLLEAFDPDGCGSPCAREAAVTTRRVIWHNAG